MKTLLQFIGVLSLIGAIIALVLHFNANRAIRESMIFVSMFASGLIQFIVFFALSEILSKLDSIIKIFKNEGKLTDETQGVTITRNK